MIEIYRISFPDGSAYVGQTKRGTRNRVAEHRTSPCNDKLYNKLLIMEPTIKVLSHHRKQEVANREERKQILRLKKPLNIYANGAPVRKNPDSKELLNNRWSLRRNRRKRRKYHRKPSGHHVCSWCWRKLPVSEFYTDRNRSTGLASRCKECGVQSWRLRRVAVKNGYSPSAAYYQAKLARQALRQTKTKPIVSVYEVS